MVGFDISSSGLLLHRKQTSARLASEAQEARKHFRNADGTEQKHKAAAELEAAVKRLSEWIRFVELKEQ
jgi:hypothetical protein